MQWLFYYLNVMLFLRQESEVAEILLVEHIYCDFLQLAGRNLLYFGKDFGQ